MKMTEQAKAYVQQAMETKGVSTLRFYGVAGCSGMNLGVALQEAEEKDVVEDIMGIQIAIQPEIKGQLTNITIDAEEENGEWGLVLIGYKPAADWT